MTGYIYEWFGYRSTDFSAAAQQARATHHCPFLNAVCTKKGTDAVTGARDVPIGVCSVESGGEVVPVCPKRMYYDDYRMLAVVADDAFSNFAMTRGANLLPILVPGAQAAAAAAQLGANQVGIFGGGSWGGEIKLPAAVQGGAKYSVDFIAVLIDPNGDVLSFVPIEVQSIDISGGTGRARNALAAHQRSDRDSVGFNWENVSKRIIPQLIFKGLMLQAEALCHRGLYFVTPAPVYRRIMLRLGNPPGRNRLRQIPQQPGSITLVEYDFDQTVQQVAGTPVTLDRSAMTTISTSDMSLAFISPENLPGPGAYLQKIRGRI